MLAEGCGEDASTAVTNTPALAENALTGNALTGNALTGNALTGNALTGNALTGNALTGNALTASALRDPLARQLLKYIVSCALTPEQTISVRVDAQTYSFDGELGLAPEWGRRDGSCDGSCQRWVSACVLARVDHAGVKRMISVRGAHPALRVSPREVAQYRVAEGAYYGNLFVEKQPRYLCVAPAQQTVERVCGPSMAECPMAVAGSCDDVCSLRGPAQSFRACRGDRHAYFEVVTVFLPE